MRHKSYALCCACLMKSIYMLCRYICQPKNCTIHAPMTLQILQWFNALSHSCIVEFKAHACLEWMVQQERLTWLFNWVHESHNAWMIKGPWMLLFYDAWKNEKGNVFSHSVGSLHLENACTKRLICWMIGTTRGMYMTLWLFVECTHTWTYLVHVRQCMYALHLCLAVAIHLP